MTLRQMAAEVMDYIGTPARPVDKDVVDRYRREMAENERKFLQEQRQREAKTAELSHRVVIG